MRRAALFALAIAALCAPANAQQASSQKYAYCQNYAQQQSGWNGSTQNPNSKAVAQSAVVGTGAGALIGGMGGGNSGRGAAIGAAFGLVAGEARRSNGAQNVQNQENNYYNILNACLQSPN